MKNLGAVVVALALLGAKKPETTHLVLRAFPRMSVAPPGNVSRVTVRAEIVGPETEDYYCPKVTWEALEDGTKSSEESDCVPYAEHDYFPRRWSRVYGAASGEHPIRVTLSRGDRTIAREQTTFWVN